MRVLAITQDDPFDRASGSLLRLRQTLAGLAEVGDVDLFELLNPVAGDGAVPRPAPVPDPYRLVGHAVRPMGRTGLGLAVAAWARRQPRQLHARGGGQLRPRLAAVVRDLQPDLVWVVREWMLDNTAPVLAEHLPGVPVICDVDDLAEQTHRSHTAALGTDGQLRARIDELMLRFVRRRSQRFADLLLATSPADVATLGPRGRLLANTFPAGADTTPPPPTDGPPTVLFAGTMDYWPNRNGQTFLVEEVWPLVRRALPTARLHLVGHQPPGPTPGDPGDGITATGRVPDMAPWLAGAHVVAAPVFGGAGTSIKVLEGFAARRPVVGTPSAFRGLPDPHRLGHVAGTRVAFAEALVQQLTEPDTDRIRTARAHVEQHHTPAAFRARVAALAAEATGGAGR